MSSLSPGTILSTDHLGLGLRVSVLLFGGHAPRLADPGFAAANAVASAHAFARWLELRGEFRGSRRVRSGLRILGLGEDRPLPEFYPLRPGEEIHVVQVGTLFFDWSARRFDPEAPFPLIWEDPLHA